MSVQSTKVEIARAKLITGLLILTMMMGSCAPRVATPKAPEAPAAAIVH